MVVRREQERHGMSNSSQYNVWKGMNRRCHNKNHKHYELYGGRGITVCDEWRTSFVRFWEDMREPYSPNLDLDRIDNNKGYSKENCRWISHSSNMANRKNTGKYMRGVSIGNGGNFVSKLKVHKIYYQIGTFNTEQEAHDAFMTIHREWYGF